MSVASLTALDGVTTADGVSVATPAVDGGGGPVAGRVLPTRAELAAVLPWPGLRRGSTVAVHGSVSLLFALLAEATEQGSWAAVVGLPGLGLVAAAEAGVEIARLALVPQPGDDPVGVIAALLDGVDLVVVGGPHRLLEPDARRLSTRARNRGAVLVPFGEWPGAEVRLQCVRGRWLGLGNGHGHLREREVTVQSSGRGAASRPRSCRLLLPGEGGALAAARPEGERSAIRALHPEPVPEQSEECSDAPAGSPDAFAAPSEPSGARPDTHDVRTPHRQPSTRPLPSGPANAHPGGRPHSESRDDRSAVRPLRPVAG
ncbi:hypothetical protein HUO13_33530 [Saccharopolyspora erythraea]|uniref:hypothetical protein n=1 Tax=Saccharopolyspora erythraea TaxID=1836 RepID=UPI001BADA8AD|nr:hypothetical protein HUO13_33530 [Saccharopolyspora erythraea]